MFDKLKVPILGLVDNMSFFEADDGKKYNIFGKDGVEKVANDYKIINKVKNKVSKILKDLPRKKIAYKSLKKNGLIIKAKNDKQIINIINTISSEHLELLVKNYKKYSNKIVNAGSICNGKYSFRI